MVDKTFLGGIPVFKLQSAGAVFRINRQTRSSDHVTAFLEGKRESASPASEARSVTYHFT